MHSATYIIVEEGHTEAYIEAYIEAYTLACIG